MLVLSRRQEESIIIGDGDSQVTVKVIVIQGDKVRLGIEAPKNIPIHRSEVYKRILAEIAAKPGDSNASGN
jgi:carbon storage regulator